MRSSGANTNLNSNPDGAVLSVLEANDQAKHSSQTGRVGDAQSGKNSRHRKCNEANWVLTVVA